MTLNRNQRMMMDRVLRLHRAEQRPLPIVALLTIPGDDATVHRLVAKGMLTHEATGYVPTKAGIAYMRKLDLELEHSLARIRHDAKWRPA